MLTSANKGFSYYLRGVEVLVHSLAAARGNFDHDYVDAVVSADPTKFRLVPPEPIPDDGLNRSASLPHRECDDPVRTAFP